MSTIDELVSVSIATSGATVPLPAFNVPLFVATNGFTTGTTTDKTRSYGSLTAVATDFATTTPEYKAAEAAFSIANPPASIKIGEIPAPVAGVMTLTFSAATVTGNVINGNVNGVALAPVDWATSDAATLAALATEIAAQPGIASAVDAGEVITVTAIAGWTLSLDTFVVTGGASQPTVAIATTTAQVLWSTGLAALLLADSAWYGLSVPPTVSDGVLYDVAAWQEARGLGQFFAQSSEAGIIASGATDVASNLQAKGYKRTLVFFHSVTTEYEAFEALAELISYKPGAAALMYKSLPGITAEDKTTTPLTESQATIARGNYTVGNQGKNVNLYDSLSGIAIVEPGISAGGQWADITIGLDWVKATLQADILTLQVNTPKIPYTDAGLALMEAEARKRIKLAQDQGIVATVPAPAFTVPLIASLSSAQRAARIFPPIVITGNLEGAVASADFSLTLLP